MPTDQWSSRKENSSQTFMFTEIRQNLVMWVSSFQKLIILFHILCIVPQERLCIPFSDWQRLLPLECNIHPCIDSFKYHMNGPNDGKNPTIQPVGLCTIMSSTIIVGIGVYTHPAEIKRTFFSLWLSSNWVLTTGAFLISNCVACPCFLCPVHCLKVFVKLAFCPGFHVTY